MKTILALLFSLSASWGITNVTLPYIVDTASIPKVKYVDKNDSALKWGVNNLGDTVNAATGTGALMRRTGATGVTLTSPTFSNPTSTGKIAADSLSVSGLTASQPIWTDAAKKLVSNAPTGTGTTLVLSASPTGTGTWSLPVLNISGKTTLTDSLVGVAERLAGNLTLSNGTSGGPSINLNSTDIGGRNFVMASGGSANGAFRVGGWNLRDATAGVTRIIVDSLGATTFAGSVEAVGTLAADGQFAFAGNGSGTTAALWRDATNGINMRGIVGSANQLELWDKAGAALLSFSNSSGAATFPNAVSMSSTLSVSGNFTVSRSASGNTVQATISNTDNTNPASTTSLLIQTGGSTAGDAYTNYSINGVSSWLVGVQNFGGSNTFNISNGASLGTSTALTIDASLRVSIQHAFGVTGVATFTAAPVFSSVTASQILSVDGSKGLTSTATTGTGSVMLAASPTTTGTLNAAAITASGTVTADTLVSSKLYTEGTFTGTITGCSSPPTPTFSYARMGKIVVIKIPAITCTSNATIFSIDGIPAGLRPGLTTDIPATSLVDGSTVRSVVGTIEVAGPTMSFFTTANSAGTWTASGNKGTNFVTFLTYTLQ